MDFEAIKRAAEGYRADMSRFLRDMIAIPSESCEEKGVVMRIKQELEKLGYDRVEIDQLGNVIGWMGTGEKIIAIDSHIDTVVFCSGEDFDLTFGLLHTVEKSAEILVKILSMAPQKLQTITPNNFRALAKDFKVTLPEEFLYEKK